MDTNAQTFRDYLTAAATHLARVARIYLHHTTPGTFSLVRCELDKLTPRRIRDGFGEPRVLEHPANVQIFKYDNSKAVEEFATFWMSKVAPLVALWRAFPSGAQFLLSLCQSLFFNAKEFRVSDLFTIRQHGKRFQPAVNTRCICRGRQWFWLTLDTKAREPFARRTAGDSQRLYLAFNGAVQLDFHLADFRELQLARLESKAGLEVRDAVSSARTKARKARFLANFESAKEGVKGFFQSSEDVLQHLRVNRAEFGANALDFGQLNSLRVIVDRCSIDAPCVSAFLQPSVVEFAAKRQRRVKFAGLRLARIDSVFERSLHLSLSLTLNVLSDGVQRRAADGHNEVRRTPKVSTTKTIPEPLELLKPLAVRSLP